MASKNRIEAGRKNGALAKGKKSQESRQKCALNSTRHGLTAKALVLGNESQSQFEELQKTYYTRFQPADEVEADLVEDMIAARWRLRRVWSVETITIELRQDKMMSVPPEKRGYTGKVTEPLRIMMAFEEEFRTEDTLRLCARYETRLYRNFERADAGLRRLQKERRAMEESQDEEPEVDAPNEGNNLVEPAKPPTAPTAKVIEIDKRNSEVTPEPETNPSTTNPEPPPNIHQP
jgi:hypothetical protein